MCDRLRKNIVAKTVGTKLTDFIALRGRTRIPCILNTETESGSFSTTRYGSDRFLDAASRSFPFFNSGSGSTPFFDPGSGSSVDKTKAPGGKESDRGGPRWTCPSASRPPEPSPAPGRTGSAPSSAASQQSSPNKIENILMFLHRQLKSPH
jgi:hypothetical protein